jgi:hypothetical protein
VDLGQVLSTSLTITSVGSLAGVGLMTGTLKNLRARLSDYDKEVEEKDRRNADDRAELAQVKTRLDALQRVVTGEAHWVKLGQVLDQHHEQAVQHWATDEQLLQQILDRLGRDR